LRSTHAAISSQGLLPLAPSFDAVGWLARSPDVLARAARVSLPARAASADGYALCPGLLETVEPAVAEAFAEAVEKWAAAGVLPHPRTVDGPDPGAAFVAFRAVQAAEAWRVHGAWIRQHPDALGPDVAARFAWAAEVTAAEQSAARAVLARIRGRFEAELGGDVLLLPTSPAPAPALEEDPAVLDAVRVATIGLTCLAPITGRPALSAPLLETQGLPVGLSLLGPRGTDLDLVARAAALA
jgi:Asp-tRNA(Asn)/Glu-tRNA(Gln) amidotransferase A subunit family amidase